MFGNRQRVNNAVPVEEAVVNGATAQMRPVLMMIVVALLGMVPAARATGIDPGTVSERTRELVKSRGWL